MLKEKDDFNWNVDPESPECVRYIGGVDISFSKTHLDIAVSCLVVLKFPHLSVVYEDHEVVKLDMEYVPGFLAFWEAAHIIKLYNKLIQTKP